MRTAPPQILGAGASRGNGPFTHIPSTVALLWLGKHTLHPEESVRGDTRGEHVSVQRRVGKRAKLLALFLWTKERILLYTPTLTLWNPTAGRRQAAPTVLGLGFYPHANTCPVLLCFLFTLRPYAAGGDVMISACCVSL